MRRSPATPRPKGSRLRIAVDPARVETWPCSTSTRYPLDEAMRSVGKPWSVEPALQRVGAEVLVHDQHGVAVGRKARSHVISSSCSAGLPMRIGGLLQMQSKRTSAGTSSGAATCDVRDAVGGGVRRAQLARPLVDVDRPHRGARARLAMASAIGPAPQPRSSRLPRCGGAAPSAAAACCPASTCPWLNTPRSVVIGHGHVGQAQLDVAGLDGAPGSLVEVVAHLGR